MAARRLKGSVVAVEGKIVLAVHPVTVGKVREGDRLETGFDGGFAQGRDSAPGCSVINILRCGQSAFRLLDKGVQDEKIHAAVTGAFGILAVALPEGVVVFGEPGAGGIPFIKLARAFYVNAIGNIHPKPVGTLDAEAE